MKRRESLYNGAFCPFLSARCNIRVTQMKVSFDLCLWLILLCELEAVYKTVYTCFAISQYAPSSLEQTDTKIK